jgi:hypothetical protein
MPTIASEWAEFAEELLPGVPPAQAEPYRRCFFAGVLAMLAISFEISNLPLDATGRARLLKVFLEEIRADDWCYR